MKEEKFLNPEFLDGRIELLDKRNEELQERETSLAEQTKQQNDFADKVWKGYKKLGLVSSEDAQIAITREEYCKRLQILEENFDRIIGQVKSQAELHDALEKYIADIMNLLTNRWNTICEYKKLWKNRRCELREKELSLLENNYVKLEKGEKEPPKWFEQATNLFTKHQQLIEEQEKLIAAEEELQDELEQIFNIRKKSLTMATELF